MEQGSRKYKEIVEILRNSKPQLNSTADIEFEVMKRVSKVGKPLLNLSDVIDFIFGWVYIGWVRRSFITASLAVVMIFVWQQGVILKRIDLLSRQVIISTDGSFLNSSAEVEKGMMMYKLAGRRISSQNQVFSERQINELLDSVRKLQAKYKDLLNMINEDPELKKLIEKKILEDNRLKTKI
jgi:hypothetical protein